jgi:hypothetical protein
MVIVFSAFHGEHRAHMLSDGMRVSQRLATGATIEQK